ncbi:MAG: hypothetical protein GF313_15455 [Caldithrix sp.]|nr:hypothetical protein [Caldithrix sp.]
MVKNIILLIIFVLLIGRGVGQKLQQNVPFRSFNRPYMEYLFNADHLRTRYIFNQPYNLSSLKMHLNHEVAGYLVKHWKHYYQPQKTVLFLMLEDRLMSDNTIYNRYRFDGGVVYADEHITFVNRTTVDQDYKSDPLFAGDLSEADHWLFGRVNDAYMDIHNQHFSFFIGRTSRNWGPPFIKSLILSDNPYTYDHIRFSYNNSRLKLSLLFGRLEDMDGYSFKHPDSLIHEARKYLVGHRLDWIINDRMQIAFTEMATYGGPDKDIELEFLNPMQFYYPVQRNDRKEMNGLWAVDFWFQPADKVHLFTQFLIDDIIVNNDPGVDDRDRYPDRLGLHLSVSTADRFIKALNTTFTYTRVWNRTYQAKFTWQNYHYRGYSLGYPCVSCEEFKLRWSYWALFPFWIENETVYGRYGSPQVTDLFPLTKETFPRPPVQYNIINRFSMHYDWSSRIQSYMKFMYRRAPDHYSNRFGHNNQWILSTGFRWLLTTGLSI